MPYLLILFAYLTGSIPFGLLLGKLFGIDIRRSGSGNIGATNVNRLLGKKLGILTLIADVGKGLLPMILASWLLAGDAAENFWVVWCGGASFLGHIFPVYLKFKGGKGVATALGIFLYLSPLAALVAVMIFCGTVVIWGFVSAGSLAAAAAMPGLVWFLGASFSQTLLAVVIAFFIWIKHRDNLVRLLNHEEKSWKQAGGQNRTK